MIIIKFRLKKIISLRIRQDKKRDKTKTQSNGIKWHKILYLQNYENKTIYSSKLNF